MKRLALLLAILCGGCLWGCRTEIKNQGEVGFRYGTEFTFFHRAAQTTPEVASAEIKSQPLNEWLERKAAEQPTPESEAPKP